MSVVRIAKQAGVSIATVSRVMTNSRHVQPETADKVRLAIEQLGLTDRQNRRRERRAGTEPRTIGIITIGREYRSWFTDPVVAAMVAEVTRAAADRRAGVVLAEMPDPNKVCAVVEEQQIEGALLLIPSELESEVDYDLLGRLPVVRIMGTQPGPTRIDHVTGDHTAIGYLAAKYLIEEGCRTLAFITLNADWPICQLRAHGFFSAADLLDKPVAVDEARAYFVSPTVPVSNSYGGMSVTGPDWPAVMKQFVQHHPSGLFVAREAELSVVYRMLAEHNLKPNRDLKVISCDNSDAWLSHLDQRPATIDLGLNQIARTAVSRLAVRMSNPDEPPLRILINPKLVLPP